MVGKPAFARAKVRLRIFAILKRPQQTALACKARHGAQSLIAILRAVDDSGGLAAFDRHGRPSATPSASKRTTT